MDEILGKHRQDFNTVRQLCLLCHGLDLTSSHLFTRSTYDAPSKKTKEVLNGFLSTSLLNLAVAIRINLYQGKISNRVVSFKSLAAQIYDDDELLYKEVTIKDVCDKILHADAIGKPVFPKGFVDSETKITFQLKGVNKQKSWTMDLSLELFTEEILKVLDELDSAVE